MKQEDTNRSTMNIQWYPGHCDAHLHLKCVDCGRLIHLDEDVSDALQSDLLRAAGFTVDGRSTTIYGTCAACGRKRDGHA